MHIIKEEKLGILIVNIGTPDQPSTRAVRKYLREFLSDPRVIEVPRLLWGIILNLIILNIRPKRSARLYKSIWTKDGSPLLVISKKQRDSLAKKIQGNGYPQNAIVVLAMRYGNPRIQDSLEIFRDQNCRRILVLPLYPQYSSVTTGSTFEKITSLLRKERWIPEIRFINSYFQYPKYIECLSSSIQESFAKYGKPQKLIFSFHGIPKKYFMKGDPYYCFCMKTSRLTTENLGLKQEDSITCFQSRTGTGEWLQPYTIDILRSLPNEGVKNIHILSPSFSADCLETLNETAVEYQKYFLEAGGENYTYIPCLNDRTDHIEFLTDLILKHTRGWQEESSAKK